MAEQRYRAVLEVGMGVPVTEVAERYGVSRQSVHAWLVRYRQEGTAGLEDRSHQVHNHPWRIIADVEELICELRRGHPKWGPRRLVFEMGRRGHQVTRSTVYRTLVRNGLVEPKARRRRRKDYRRWERGTAMELWQLDVTASAFLTSGAEVKIVTGVDDHSRFCVLAKAVMRATARPVCLAFVEAMRVYGIPEEVLTDNGKVFTGRFHKPGVAVEVLFDKICRENGITHRLTKIHSPTTTGKIERLHQTLQRELLDVHGPFESIEALQTALDAWRLEYNTDRPHQSLGMNFPASRFRPASSPLELRIPAQLTASTGQPKPPPPAPGSLLAPSLPVQAAPPLNTPSAPDGQPAVEVDRVVPPSGNLWIGGQQVWLGPALSGRQITLWADAISLHVLLDGTRIKTLPSRIGATELARLAASGARPAGPSPLPAGAGAVIEVDRTVNATGLVSLADQQVGVGSPLAGQRVTLRMEGPLMAVLSYDGTLLRTLVCPIPADRRYRLRGARRGRSLPPQPGGPITVQRRVSSRGGLMVARQKIHAGMIHAGKTATVICENNHFRVVIDGETAAAVPRTTTSEVHRYKANATDKRAMTRRTPEGP
ncbi:MAG: IS481 family transposase [Streptosporangiaceae bacterium]|nr:IS481 family transposase [Streptosporangiaceae bacterium]